MAAGPQAAALGTFVFAGDLALQMHGMSIGGAMSSAAVAVKLGFEEAKGFSDQKRFQAVGFPAGNIEKESGPRRYVDDVLGASYMYCSGCLLVALRASTRRSCRLCSSRPPR